MNHSLTQLSAGVTTLRQVQELDNLVQSWLDSDVIGTLCRQGRTIFYAVLSGTDCQTVEGVSRTDVARKLVAHSLV